MIELDEEVAAAGRLSWGRQRMAADKIFSFN